MAHYSTASVETDHASKYLQQLCKHFAHKVEVSYDRHAGHVTFPMGICLMKANDNILHFRIQADSEEAVQAAQSVIDVHLVKFAWREELSVSWRPEISSDMRGALDTA